MEGFLLKRSEHLHAYRTRTVIIVPPRAGGKPFMYWKGGRQPGTLVLDEDVVAFVDDTERLVLHDHKRTFFFRTQEANEIHIWHRAIEEMRARAATLPIASLRPGLPVPTPAKSDDAEEEEILEVCRTFYLNIVVLNKDDAVALQVNEKIGKGPLGAGLVSKAATAIAKRAVRDEAVGSKVSTGLIAKLPDIIGASGIDIAMTQCYVGGPLVVLRCDVNDVDGVKLMHSNKGEEAARQYGLMTEALVALGLNVQAQNAQAKLIKRTTSTLKEKLSTLVPAKLLDESGIRVDAVCTDEAAQAEWFFTFLGAHAMRA